MGFLIGPVFHVGKKHRRNPNDDHIYNRYDYEPCDEPYDPLVGNHCGGHGMYSCCQENGILFENATDFTEQTHCQWNSKEGIEDTEIDSKACLRSWPSITWKIRSYGDKRNVDSQNSRLWNGRWTKWISNSVIQSGSLEKFSNNHVSWSRDDVQWISAWFQVLVWFAVVVGAWFQLMPFRDFKRCGPNLI